MTVTPWEGLGLGLGVSEWRRLSRVAMTLTLTGGLTSRETPSGAGSLPSSCSSVPGQELSLQHGLSAGTTGNLLLLVMMIIYAAANDKVKRSHYETFWCAHHCSP